MSLDPNQSERFFVPPAVIHFLVALTLPTHADRILNINLKPGLLHPEIKNRIHREPDFVKSTPTLEDLEKLEQTYDVILCGPTFGISAGELPSGTGEPGEEFWLKWSINHLSKSGRLAVIVPNGLLSNYSQQNIRKFLLEKSAILAIIELPLGWSQSTNVQASILLVTLAGNPERNVKMFRFSKFEAIPWASVASSVLSQDEKISHKDFKCFTIEASQLSSERLDANYHDPKYKAIPKPDPNIFRAFALSDVVNISGGERLSKEKFNSYGIPYIQVANVGIDGNLYLRDASFVDPEKVKSGVKAGTQRCHCIRGDLIITIAGTIGKVTLIDDKQPSYGVYINTSSSRLRIKDTNVVLPEYLFIHLRSEIIQLQIARLRSGSVIPVLSNTELGKVTVYIPPLAKQQELIGSLQGATLKQSQKILSRFYGIEQEQDTSHERKFTPKPVVPPSPPIEEVIIREFPFPIARAFSMFQRSERLSPNDQIQELIALSEAIVYYLSAICVADQVTHLKIVDKDLLANIRSSFSDRSMKKRLDIISAIQEFAKQASSIPLFVPEIAQAEIGICKGINKQIRNEKAHTQPKTEFENEKLMTKVRPQLKRLLESLRFLKDYKLVSVRPVAFRNNRYVYKFEYLTTDNNVFQLVDDDLENPLSVETGHVLLMNNKTEFLDLHPFYLFRGWESTGGKEDLCFLKYYNEPSKRDSKRRLLIESSLRAGEHEIDGDDLEALLNGLPVLQ